MFSCMCLSRTLRRINLNEQSSTDLHWLLHCHWWTLHSVHTIAWILPVKQCNDENVAWILTKLSPSSRMLPPWELVHHIMHTVPISSHVSCLQTPVPVSSGPTVLQTLCCMNVCFRAWLNIAMSTPLVHDECVPQITREWESRATMSPWWTCASNNHRILWCIQNFLWIPPLYMPPWNTTSSHHTL
jgi:hypothetical protein